jgi:imidazolonepropionase-like amidohydrolase
MKIEGSIERGKLADLIVVSADPLTIGSDQGYPSVDDHDRRENCLAD